MNPAVYLHQKVEDLLKKTADKAASPERLTVVVATTDPEIRSGLTELFEALPVNVVWLKGVEAAKGMLAREKVDACFCGFWLQDGTYRELVRHIRRECAHIPVIVVSAPSCPDDYRDYLTAANIGTLDYLGYPYRKSDLQRMLWTSIVPDGNAMDGTATAPVLGAQLQRGIA